MKFILASNSKSRKELLSKIGFYPDIFMPMDINETPKKKEKPRLLALRLAIEKAEAALKKNKEENADGSSVESVILGGDTVISVGNRIIDKALDKEQVIKNMKMLSGRNHMAYSAFCVLKIDKDGSIMQKIHKVGITRVKFKHLSQLDIDNLVASGTGIGVAGGYTVDGIGSSFIISSTGSSHTNIMGIPSYLARNALMSVGLKSSFNS